MPPTKLKPCIAPHAEIVADPELWQQCEFVGIQEEEDPNFPDLELRNCTCGFTLAREVEEEDEEGPTENPPRDSRYWVAGVMPTAKPGFQRFDAALALARRQAKASGESVDIIWGVAVEAPLGAGKTDIFGRTIVEKRVPVGRRRRRRFRRRRGIGVGHAEPFHAVASVLPDGELITHSPEDVPVRYAEGAPAPPPPLTRAEAARLGRRRQQRRESARELRQMINGALRITEAVQRGDDEWGFQFRNAVLDELGAPLYRRRRDAGLSRRAQALLNLHESDPAKFNEEVLAAARQIASLDRGGWMWNGHLIRQDSGLPTHPGQYQEVQRLVADMMNIDIVEIPAADQPELFELIDRIISELDIKPNLPFRRGEHDWDVTRDDLLPIARQFATYDRSTGAWEYRGVDDTILMRFPVRITPAFVPEQARGIAAAMVTPPASVRAEAHPSIASIAQELGEIGRLLTAAAVVLDVDINRLLAERAGGGDLVRFLVDVVGAGPGPHTIRGSIGIGAISNFWAAAERAELVGDYQERDRMLYLFQQNVLARAHAIARYAASLGSWTWGDHVFVAGRRTEAPGRVYQLPAERGPLLVASFPLVSGTRLNAVENRIIDALSIEVPLDHDELHFVEALFRRMVEIVGTPEGLLALNDPTFRSYTLARAEDIATWDAPGVAWIHEGHRIAVGRPPGTLVEGRIGQVVPALPERYQRAYDRVLDAMNRADEIGGPEGAEYVAMMDAIRDIAARQTQAGQSVVERGTYGETERASSWTNFVIDAMSYVPTDDRDAYRTLMNRIASVATVRRNATEAGRAERRQHPVGTPPPVVPPQLDMRDVRGQPEAVAAAELAVATHQNLLLSPARSTATHLAQRIPSIMPRAGTVPFRAPHFSIVPPPLGSTPAARAGGIAALASEVRLASGGVLYLADVDEFNIDGLRQIVNELLMMSDPPLIVASVNDVTKAERASEILGFRVRAEMQDQVSASYGEPADDSATIKARIKTKLETPEDVMAARYAQLELGRSTEMGMSPAFRSARFKGQLPVGTRVQLLRTIVHGTDVYMKGMTGTVERNDQDRIEIRPDNIAEPGTQYLVYDAALMEQLAGDLEIESEATARGRELEFTPGRRISQIPGAETEDESAKRFGMIELNPKNNPAWVTSLLAKHFEFLEGKVPAKWLPKLTKTKAKRGKLTAAMKEYGCGVYGCVLPTLDPKVVLKITTDDTEAQFADKLANDLTAQVTVVYHLIAGLPEKHKGRNTYLLWRDSADRVGEINKVVEEGGGDGNLVEAAVDDQHKAAQQVYVALMEGKPALKLIETWKKATLAMGRKVPELAELADGLITNLIENKVFMGDIHAGNIGRVDGRWLVVDPGNVAVLEA